MARSGSHKAHRAPSVSTERGPALVKPDARIAELEAQLELAGKALQSQRSSYDEDSASFEKTLSRLAQSERSLSQTKARLVDVEAFARAEQARADGLAAELASLRATSAAELAAARESASAAEARAQQAATLARAARFEQAANVAELEELQGKVEDLQAEVAAGEERNSVLSHERTRLLGLLASLEVLAREITHLTLQAATARPSLPKVEGWLGRDVEAEHIRATLRPQGFSAPASRSRSAPELVVDGVKLES